MQTVDVLVFSDFPGGLAPHEEGEIAIRFHRVGPHAPAIRFDGPVWAFIDFRAAGRSGLELCRQLRCNPTTTRANIVAVSVEDTKDRLRAARAGASECMQTSVTREAIVRRVLDRSIGEAGPRTLALGDLAVNFAACQARWRNKPLRLGPTQLRLLMFLIRHPGRTFSRKQLLDALGHDETDLDERTVDVWIQRTRKALENAGACEVLQTVRHFGYMLAAAA